MNETVGVAEVLRVMEEVVTEFGTEHVYKNPLTYTHTSSSCRYVHGNVPGCLVGQILFRLGAPIQVMAKAEASHGVGINDLMDVVGDSLGFKLTQNAIQVLAEAQNLQDVGNTWGAALRRAQEVAEPVEV